ncbi:MAG: nucleotide exchange factor GrpE [Bdellovibrionales bacterium]
MTEKPKFSDQNIKAENEPARKPGNGPDQDSAAGKEGAAKIVPISSVELEALKKQAGEREEYLDLARRTQAEFQNYQKRNQREREQERQFLAGSLMRDLLPVLDNLERALNAAQKEGEQSPLVQGVGMVQTQFLDLLKRNGVSPIEAVGQPFDPKLHEALVQQPSPDHPPNTVIQVVENGYQIFDRVLRPAKVIVSSGPQ